MTIRAPNDRPAEKRILPPPSRADEEAFLRALADWKPPERPGARAAHELTPIEPDEEVTPEDIAAALADRR